MGCSENGEPPPAPLADPERVDELRSAAGLPPLADHLAEMEKALTRQLSKKAKKESKKKR